MTAAATTPVVFGSPGRYIQGPGALARLPALIEEFGARRPLIVADAFVRALLQARVPALERSDWIEFGGECTAEEVDRLAGIARTAGSDLLVGTGGGKSIDAAKGAQILIGGPIFVVPTVASTDAPTSRVAVLYTADHRLAEVRRMRANPDVVLVDSDVLAKAPRRFFVSGLGDALSKRFEVQNCIDAGGTNFYQGRQAGLTRLITRGCFDVLMADTASALAVFGDGRPNAAFERVLEATILLSGLAFENGGLSVAHSLTRGLSTVPALHGCLHGEEVAFGLVVQLLLEPAKHADTLAQLLPYYRLTGLPTGLAGLGWRDGDGTPLAAVARQIAEVTVATSPHLQHFSRSLRADEIAAAVVQACTL